MTDTDEMPFGKYKGLPMIEVPASYLHWYYHNASYPGQTQSYNYNLLIEYIEKSWDSLQQETPDLIWKERNA